MRIGELAERAGISTKAIRYYEQIGILTPPERNASGYRAFAS
jgi:DNA-binding transcriptional MerR regulator